MMHEPASSEERRDIDQAILDEIPQPNRKMAPVRWYGGKGMFVKKLLNIVPYRKLYVEPYCGAASLFWHREPSPVEVLNDIYEDIINLFRVLQDPEKFEELAHRLLWTPYSCSEFCRALEVDSSCDPVSRAWALFVRQNQGFSGLAKSKGNWSKTFISSRGMAKTTSKWRGRLKNLKQWHERLTRVQLDCRDALECIRYWDSEETVFYVDPPYPADTRSKGSRIVYTHECIDEHHEELIDVLLTVKGIAVVSGYDHPVYAKLNEKGWQRSEFQTVSYAAGRNRGTKMRGAGALMEHVPRTEIVWSNVESRADFTPIEKDTPLFFDWEEPD